ncbi:spermatogenesis-associated serine-rich protein 2-like isoform X2 [Stegodyphus dumicola]|nr:spermatogenesis-associated serine-rich protein 2-like isoform X2 [Stegodyphus dumicola]
MASESNKQKITKIHDMFPNATKDHIAKILQYYDDDESKAIDAITRDGGKEALSNSLADSGSLKSKNNKNKKKKKKGKKEMGIPATASFDADDSSSLHSSSNVDADIEKESQRTENGNIGITDDRSLSSPLSSERLSSIEVDALNNSQIKGFVTNKQDVKFTDVAYEATASEMSCSTNEIVSKCPKSAENVCESPVSDCSEKQEEVGIKKEKHRTNSESHIKHIPRQRTGSFRRTKTSSTSEDASSQHNPLAAAAPTKRGYEKCKKDLNRQTISLQRIHAQLDKGLEESEKKLKNAFNDIKKLLDKRQELVELELEKTKEEALNLIKSRQELALDLKRRVDRTPSLTEAQWAELRSDIKQFVTERKYDEELGKTIWFQWCLDNITESIENFGEVHPVKNVYSQRSHSALGNSDASHNNPEPSPSSSIVNEEISSLVDKNDVANISDTVEDETPTAEKSTVPQFRNQPSENRTRVYSNTRYAYARHPSNRGQGFFRGNRGGGYQQRPYNRNFTYNRNNSYNNYDMSGDYRNHPHQERDGPSYPNDRNFNNNSRDNRNDRSKGRGQRRPGNGGRYRGNMAQRQNMDNVPKTEPSSTDANAPVDIDKSKIVNGWEN